MGIGKQHVGGDASCLKTKDAAGGVAGTRDQVRRHEEVAGEGRSGLQLSGTIARLLLLVLADIRYRMQAAVCCAGGAAAGGTMAVQLCSCRHS